MAPQLVINNHGLALWVADRAGCGWNPPMDSCIGVLRDADRPWGGVIYTGYTGKGGSIEAHVAGDGVRWATRDLLWAAFDYPFQRLGCRVLLGRVNSSNLNAVKLDLKLGFKVATVIPNGYPNGDMLVLSMRRDECRFLDIQPRGIMSGVDHAGQ
jgi:hypothetical protein